MDCFIKLHLWVWNLLWRRQLFMKHKFDANLLLYSVSWFGISSKLEMLNSKSTFRSWASRVLMRCPTKKLNTAAGSIPAKKKRKTNATVFDQCIFGLSCGFFTLRMGGPNAQISRVPDLGQGKNEWERRKFGENLALLREEFKFWIIARWNREVESRFYISNLIKLLFKIAMLMLKRVKLMIQ